MRNWFLVDGERMLLTEDEAEEYDGDGCDVVAERDSECACLPDLPDGRTNGGKGTVCIACARLTNNEEIPY